MVGVIQNDDFRVSARDTGAELISFIDKRDEDAPYEYIWQKDKAVWTGSSPLLFPIVGKLKGDTYRLYGQTWQLEKHGFARKARFEMEYQGAQEMTFLLRDSEATRAVYPFPFELRVHYHLIDRGFVMEHRVKNTGSETMYFSLGAHPGFQCAMGDQIVLDEVETAGAYRLDKDFLRGPELEPVFANSRELTITPDIFARDALIFDGLRSRGASLIRQNGRSVHVDFGGAPCLGIWAKPGAPYVCIEPWYGIDDAWNADGDFAHKERICALEAGQEFLFPVTITIL